MSVRPPTVHMNRGAAASLRSAAERRHSACSGTEVARSPSAARRAASRAARLAAAATSRPANVSRSGTLPESQTAPAPVAQRERNSRAADAMQH